MNDQPVSNSSDVSRRDFLKTTAVAGTAVAAASFVTPIARGVWGSGGRAGRIKVGVVGCGGRGTGAAADCLTGSPDTEIVAIGDVMKDRVNEAKHNLTTLDGGLSSRVNLGDRTFTGFDAYKQVLASGIDMVILATAPGFRPIHFEAAVNAGKHIFFEKPVGVDPTGIRKVLAAGELAKTKGLSVVTGTQRRHETCYLEAMKRIQDGAIGKVVAANVWWNQGLLWDKPRQAEWSDMEYQIRNWLYYTWLSGDHIVEQHVHNIDVMNWAMGTTPKRCIGLGGRQSRTDAKYGHIFDHFAIQYVYDEGRVGNSQCRQADGCDNKVSEQIIGTEGIANLSSGFAEIKGKSAWKFDGKKNNAPYVQEHTDLVKSIQDGKPINEAERIAHSTLTAIMGRMSAYTGKEVSWEQAMTSKLDTMPKELAMGSMPTPEVAIPGKTPLI